MTRDEVKDYLTHWGIAHRCNNICGWDNESILYKIMKSAIQIVDFKKPTTTKEIEGELVGENKQQVGADAKQLDHHKVVAIDDIISTLTKTAPELVVIANRLYVENRSERVAATNLGITRKRVRTLHSNLILFIQNEMELK